MKITILIPVHNEERTLEKVIFKVSESMIPGFEKEIIVINDGSTDQSSQILDRLKEQLQLKVVTHSNKKGKGAAIISGIKEASGDLVLIQDADLEYDPEDYPIILEPFLKAETQAVYGVRKFESSKNGYFVYVHGSNLLDKFCNLLFNSNLHDIYTGSKCIRTELLRSLALESPGFEIEAEITAKLLRKKVFIIEVPVSYNPRTFEEGKKIRLKDGFKGLLALWRYK